MKPTNPNDLRNTIEARLRTIRTLWFSLFISVGLYFLITIFVKRAESQDPNNLLFIVLVGVALAVTLISFVLKEQFVRRAIEQQQPDVLQQGFIVAWALNEAPALFGLVIYFASGNHYYFVLFIISTCGHLLNFPRRAQVESVYFK